MWCPWVHSLWRALQCIKRALKCVLAGRERSVANNPQSSPGGPPWVTPHLNWMQPPNPVCHHTHSDPSPPDGEMNQRERASSLPLPSEKMQQWRVERWPYKKQQMRSDGEMTGRRKWTRKTYTERGGERERLWGGKKWAREERVRTNRECRAM